MVAWTLRVAALMLLISVAIGSKEVTLGLLFGLCVGLINFDLMTRFNAALLNNSKGGIAVLGMLVRFGLFFAGAAGVWYKGWNFIAAAVGCFSVYPVLLAHGFLMGRSRTVAPAETEG